MEDVNNNFWWEKTVEYLFVKQHINIDDLIAPLDGNHEKGGDAIIGRVAKWLLIEFKVDEDSLDSEFAKFGGEQEFEAAKRELIFESDHHLLVYGRLDDEKLKLACNGYFHRMPIDLNKALTCGIDFEEFNVYLSKLLTHKRVETTGKNSGTVGKKKKRKQVNYDRVIGIGNDGQVSESFTLNEYVERCRVNKELKLKLELSQKIQEDSSPKQDNSPSATFKP